MTVYLITNRINEKKYVGQTICSLKTRFSQHCSATRHVISKAILKYGKENFFIEPIEQCESREELNQKEEYYIQYYNTVAPNGYNIELGGLNRTKHELTRSKLSKANKGRVVSQETREKIKKSMLELDPDYYKKLRANHSLPPCSGNHRKNLSLSKGRGSESFVGVTRCGPSFRMEFEHIDKRERTCFKNEVAAAHAYDTCLLENGFEAVNFPLDIWSREKVASFISKKKRKGRFYGVAKTRHNTFSVIFWLNKKTTSFGTFATEEEAARKVNEILIQNNLPPRNDV